MTVLKKVADDRQLRRASAAARHRLRPPGNLCIYLTEEVNLDETAPLTVESNTRLGFGLVAKSKAGGDFTGYGQWAVTAP